YIERLYGFARVFHYLAYRLAVFHVWLAQYGQHEILGRDIVRLATAHVDTHRLWHLYANIFCDPGVENIGCANPESNASDSARVGSVRVRPDDELPRK